MQVFDWNTSEAQPVTELYRRMVAQGENISLARLEVAKGSRTRAHHHRHEELIILLKGKWQFQFPTGEVTLGPNQILKIPPGVEHSSEVLEDAIAIDVCSPRRDDWIFGDDHTLHYDPDQELWGV
jgi:quercetin dioxygenase-like cupin family protein